MTVQITILGLGQIGTSIGLALGGHKDLVRRIGNDLDPNIARRAEKMGAVDHVFFNLPSAVRQADLVVLASPVDQIHEILEAIAQDLKEGAVVIDTSFAKESVSNWAADLLPAESHYVSWTPTINPLYLHENTYGIEAAHADLFHDCLIFITCPLGTAAPAIKLATDLTSLVGGKPFYADQAEVDGLVAANTLLPQLTAAALLNSVMSQPGWNEARKLAGQAFAMSTAPVMGLEGKKNLAQAALLNRENVLRVLDNFSVAVEKLKNSIRDGDEKSLQEQMLKAVENREQWIQERKENSWISTENQIPLPTAGEVLGRLVSFGRPRQSPPKKTKK